jgi:O-acetyl-ADP-ribose deacetylase (regulator of RNase III)/NAD-dependent SIR2 family protein deacetylase
MKFIRETEAVRYLLQEPGRYVCYLGAGASAEAGIPTSQFICAEIRDKLRDSELPGVRNKSQISRWENSRLNWNDPSQRYSSCIRKAYPNKATRVEYFRKKLQGRRPSFCHHAVALLVTNNYFKPTCLTTNFDKLLENAFTQQMEVECQAIRTDSEVQYWQNDTSRRYVIKLHGDYDTYNILNTTDETITISERMIQPVNQLLRDAGMLVLGTAGTENSISAMFNSLASPSSTADRVLSFGLLWGVYMGQSKPTSRLSDGELEKLILNRIKQGEVGRDIASMMTRMSHQNELFCFFPVWGAADFMFDLINRSHDRALIGKAELFLDHEMRVRNSLTHAELTETAIDSHLSSLRKEREKLLLMPSTRSALSEKVFRASGSSSPVEVCIAYGDITSRSQMSATEFSALRWAVVSTDDTCLSAGGGVALSLLEKAGPRYLINELAKMSPPVKHPSVVVTSGGNLPVQYLLHAACIQIEKNGSYTISEADVLSTMTMVLEQASALDIKVLWVPLIGAGVGPLAADRSLEAILSAIRMWSGNGSDMLVNVVIYREAVLSRDKALECLNRALGKAFTVSQVQ